jgi:hypothetical protein
MPTSTALPRSPFSHRPGRRRGVTFTLPPKLAFCTASGPHGWGVRPISDVPSPATVPTAIPADATDIRATLLVGYSAVRPSATAINGAPFALSSMGTALRQEQSGGEDGRDSEYSKHNFISLVGHALDRVRTGLGVGLGQRPAQRPPERRWCRWCRLSWCPGSSAIVTSKVAKADPPSQPTFNSAMHSGRCKKQSEHQCDACPSQL